MRSFLYFILVLMIMLGSFAGGIFSASYINSDPFLSALFPMKHSLYDQFIHDVVQAVENAIQSEAVYIQGSSGNLALQDPALAIIPQEEAITEIPPSSHAELLGEFDENYANNQKTQAIDLSEVTKFITDKMTPQEKVAFLFWMRSRFDTSELVQLYQLMQQELTPEGMIKIYKNLRENLKKPDDYEYLFSVVDRFLIPQQPTVSLPQWPSNRPAHIYYME